MKLKELRARYSMTQTKLGKVAGVTSKTVARWESGRADMSFKAAVKFVLASEDQFGGVGGL